MKKQYKIAIRGGYGLTNFGDDALMYVLYMKLKTIYIDNDIIFLCKKSSYIKKVLPSCNIIDTREEKVEIETDILLYGGGTQFYTFPGTSTGPLNFVTLLLKYRNDPILLIKKILIKIQKKFIPKKAPIQEHLTTKSIAAIGIGVGPFLNNVNQNIEIETKKIFLEMDYIAVRDIYSFDKCKNWGVNKVQHFSDLCYLMDYKDFPFLKENKHSKVKNIGIIVRDWDHTDEGSAYYSKIDSLIYKLENEGYDVTIIIFAKNRDLFWLKKLKNEKKILQWDPDIQTINEFIESLSHFDLFITARYHGAVFATLLNKPFVTISVEQKLDMISDIYVNASKKWQYPFDIEQCIDSVRLIDDNYDEFVEQVKLTTEKQQILAQNMLDDFLEYSQKFN